jgi:hypothetical protein
MFSGPPDTLAAALKAVVAGGRLREEQPLHLDFVQVEQYFILRLIGSSEDQDFIRAFLDR